MDLDLDGRLVLIIHHTVGVSTVLEEQGIGGFFAGR